MFGLFGNPSRKKFAGLVLDELRRLGKPADYAFDEAAFTLKRGTDSAHLENTYAAYCQAKGAHRKQILANFVGALAAGDSFTQLGFEQTRELLVSGVRETILSSFSSTYWMTGDATKKPAHAAVPLSRWFSETVLIDFPTHMALVGEGQLREWGITFEEALALGKERLRQSTTPKFAHDRGVYVGTWKDDYDSSRVVLPGLFDDLPLAGKPVVVLPNRLTLMVAGSDDPEAIRRMLERAEEIVRTEAKPQNPAPLLVDDGRITDFVLAPDSPAFDAVQRAHGLAALLYYNEQQKALEDFHTKTGKDIHVAKFSLMQDQAGRYGSHTLWVRDVIALLPEADHVLFYEPDAPEAERIVARVPWAIVKAQLDDLMLDTQLFPPRHYVSRFPTPEQLAAMRAASA